MDQHSKTYNQIAGQKTQRIEALSDGVFAIAMTLLILDLKVPLRDTIYSEGDLVHAFCALTPKLLSYFMGFMTLGIFWVGQTTQYGFIERSDRHLSWLTLFFLMFVSLVPFTTAFLSEHIAYRFSIAVYWANIFALGATILAHWRYAYRHDLLSGDRAQNDIAHQAITRRVLIAQALYAIGALLCLVNIYLSITVIILIQLNYALAPFQRITVARSTKKKQLHSHP